MALASMHQRLHLAGSHTDLPDGAWASIAPLVAGPSGGPGRPARDHRVVVNGILWVLDTGAPWRHVPAYYGPWQTLYGRYARWQADGTWRRVTDVLRAHAAGRAGRRTVAIVLLSLLAALIPQPARAQRPMGARALRPLAAYAAVGAGRRRGRLRYGVRPTPATVGLDR